MSCMPTMQERVQLTEAVAVGSVMAPRLTEHIESHVECDITHLRPSADGSLAVLSTEHVINQITNSGRDQLHLQGYSSVAAGGSAPSSSGFNFIALTNTAITPGAGDTALSGEISLERPRARPGRVRPHGRN